MNIDEMFANKYVRRNLASSVKDQELTPANQDTE